MDINYHYFVVKTLACHAGFQEKDAQTIAYYSQQVDNFNLCEPVCVEQKPPQFFFDHHYAKKAARNLWFLMPHPTGINMAASLGKEYRHTSLAPFHFIPAQPFEVLEKKGDFTRKDYRCVPACEESAVLIREIAAEAVEAVRKNKCRRSLIQLGMALHTYAATYAHCGYSGLEGWENKAVIQKAWNQKTGKEEIPEEERIFFKELPHIGHGNAGIVPDISVYQIDVACQKDEADEELSLHIIRDNLTWFLQCSKEIMEMLCIASGEEMWDEDAWDTLKGCLAEAMQVPAFDEMKKKALIPHWKKFFPDIKYKYEKNQRFYLRGKKRRDNVIWPVVQVTEDFFLYNELSYRRAEKVLGEERLKEYCLY